MLATALKLPSRIDLANSQDVLDCCDRLDAEAVRLYDTSQYAHKGLNHRKIFLTLATPDYHWGLVTLIRSIRTHSDYPIFVMMVSPWDFTTTDVDVFILPVPNLSRDDKKRHRQEFSNTFAKLWAFGLLSFDRVVFLDSDVLVTGQINELFDGDQFLACRDSVDWCRPDQFNSGVMALTPTKAMLDDIANRGAVAESYDGGDQGLLNTLFKDRVQFIGSEFNTTRHYWYLGAPEVDQSKIKAIHYIVKKPWDLHYKELPDALLMDLDDRWTDQLTHPELKSLVRHWRRKQFLAERHIYDATRQGRKAKKKRKQNTIIAIASVAVLMVLSLGFAMGHYIH